MSALPALTPEQIKDFAHAAYVGDIIVRNIVAATGLLVWDWIVTWGDEVDRVWSSRWTRVSWKSVIYLIVRYFSLAVQCLSLSNAFLTTLKPFRADSCRSWFIFRSVSLSITISAVQIILVLQVCALYKRKHIVVFSLSGLLALQAICTFGAFIPYVARTIRFIAPACQPFADQLTRVHHTSALLLGMPLLLQLILCALTVKQMFVTRKQGWGRHEAQIVSLIARDGTWAFFLTTLGVSCMMITVLSGSVWQAVVFPWFETVLSLTGVHLLLNIGGLSFGRTPKDDDDEGMVLTTRFISLGDVEAA